MCEQLIAHNMPKPSTGSSKLGQTLGDCDQTSSAQPTENTKPTCHSFGQKRIRSDGRQCVAQKCAAVKSNTTPPPSQARELSPVTARTRATTKTTAETPSQIGFPLQLNRVPRGLRLSARLGRVQRAVGAVNEPCAAEEQHAIAPLQRHVGGPGELFLPNHRKERRVEVKQVRPKPPRGAGCRLHVAVVLRQPQQI